MKLSDYLFELRKTEDLTQKQAAHKIGVSRKMVGHYEKGGVTPKENTQHSIYHGMTPIGEKAHKSKLALKEAISIRLSKRSDTELAKKYGVSRAQVYRIKKGLNWSMAIAKNFDELEEEE